MTTYSAQIANTDGGSSPILIEAGDLDEAEAIAVTEHGRQNVLSVACFDVETPSGFF